MADDKTDLPAEAKEQADAVMQDQKWAKDTKMKDVDSSEAQGGSGGGDSVHSRQREPGGPEL